MYHALRSSFLGLAALSVGGAAAPVAAQAGACALATNEEVQKVAEVDPMFARFWQPPEALGQSRCEYSGGSLEVYGGKSPEAAFERTLETFKAQKEPRVPVAGLGDRAFFMIPKPNDPNQRIGLLAVYAGPRVVVLTLDAHGKEPVAAVRPRLESFARLVLPRIR
jgi:hypothetical protein